MKKTERDDVVRQVLEAVIPIISENVTHPERLDLADTPALATLKLAVAEVIEQEERRSAQEVFDAVRAAMQNRPLVPLDEFMRGMGFTIWQTGGGCLAWGWHDAHTDYQILLTDEDACLPLAFEEAYLGLYRDASEGGVQVDHFLTHRDRVVTLQVDRMVWQRETVSTRLPADTPAAAVVDLAKKQVRMGHYDSHGEVAIGLVTGSSPEIEVLSSFTGKDSVA